MALTYRISVVCLGNICRSPMAGVVLADKVAEAGLDVEVRSGGTGDWHVGGPIDERAGATLAAAGYDGTAHRAQQYTADWYDDADLVLVMDESNLADVRALTPGHDDRIRLFRDFDPAGPGVVPDPYHGGEDGFADVLATVERTSDAIVAELGQDTSGRHEGENR